jgi:dTMP kinase
MKGKLIAFDGLDCSFKETNTREYLNYLLNKEEKAALYSFPRYNKDQSVFVRHYLAGDYGSLDQINPTLISSFYMLDMFDCAQKEIIPKLKKGYTIILDRYWYCNLFYRLGAFRMTGRGSVSQLPIELSIIKGIENLAKMLNLPKADIIIKLKANPKVMLDFVHAKKSKKDQHESNDKFLLSVSEVFDTIDLSDYAKDKVVEVYTTENGKIRSKEDILNRIIRGIEND